MISIDKNNFNIEHILESGQCFRWNKLSNGNIGFITDEKYFELIDNKTMILLQCNLSYFEGFLKDYFDLSTDYNKIKNIADKNDTYLQNAILKYGDIRILHQDLWETIISFIISQRKNIPAIKTSIRKLSERYGKTIDGSPLKFSFPNAKTISELSLKDIRDCGVGYRDEYIKAAAQWYLSNMNKSITKNDVLEIPGVGKKISNCIGLFGLHDLSCCPIDVWMQKIIDNRYNGKLPAWMDSEYAGVYQQYVFMYERFISKNR